MRKHPSFVDGYFRVDSEDPAVPGRITELRTHGVSGKPPEDLVNDPHPVFLSGDDQAGFYRRRGRPEVGPERTVEAYSWSGLNSRSSSRAFLLLLFPFAMVNHAGWMIGPKANGAWQRALIRLVGLMLTVHYVLWAMVIFVDLLAYQCGGSPACRDRYLLGWFNSIIEFVGPSSIRQVIVFAALPVMVVVLLTRGAGSRKEAPPDEPDSGPVPPIDRLPLTDGRFWHIPRSGKVQGSAHGIAALAVVGATLAQVIGELAGPGAGDLSTIRALGWAFWVVAAGAAGSVVYAGFVDMQNAQLERWQRWTTACGLVFALLMAWLVLAAWNLPAFPRGSHPVLSGLQRSFDLVIVAEFGLLMLFFLFDQSRIFVSIPAIGGSLFWALNRPEGAPVAAVIGWPAQPWQQWILTGALLALLATSIYGFRNRLTGAGTRTEQSEPDDPLHHLNNQFWIFFGLAPIAISAFLGIRSALGVRQGPWAAGLGIIVCVAYLMAVSRIQIRLCHDYPPRWRLKVGGPAALAAVGAIALTLISSAVIVFVAQRLGSAFPVGAERQPGPVGNVAIGYYDELGWIAAAGLGSLIVFALAFGTRIAALWRFRFAQTVGPMRDSPASTEGLAPARAASLPGRTARARMFACLIDDLDWMVTVGVVAFMASAFAVLIGQAQGRSAGTLDRFVGFASWLLVSLAFLMIWVIRTAQKDSGVRRAIGTLWEVTSFFPRRFHPLGPPSYGERAVPEMRDRLCRLTENDGQVLLLAHSQGTLLSSAVLLSMMAGEARAVLPRIRFITYGCMLQRSYGRSFPHLVKRADLWQLKADLEGLAAGRPADDRFPLPPEGSLPRWMNFGRTTDFLGGRLFAVPHRPPGCTPEQDRVDDIFFDDPLHPEKLGDREEAQLWLHSFDYLHDREDQRFIEHVLATLADMELKRREN